MNGFAPMNVMGGGVTINEGEKGNPLSMIIKTQHINLWSTNNQRAYQKVKQPICMKMG
jgi:hypothetical protein